MERSTRQRQAICQALKQSDRPLSIREVFEAARAIFPSLGLATVYRALRELAAEGWLRVVPVPGEAPRYEPIGKGHHHHFLCRRCGRLYDIEQCLASLYSFLPAGFQLEEHDVLLQGRCTECAIDT